MLQGLDNLLQIYWPILVTLHYLLLKKPVKNNYLLQIIVTCYLIILDKQSTNEEGRWNILLAKLPSHQSSNIDQMARKKIILHYCM